jgi:hypothetical protein
MVTDLFLVCAYGSTVHWQKQIRPLSCSYVSWAPGDKKQRFFQARHVFVSVAAPTKLHFIQLDFSFESACFQLTDMISRFPQSLAESCDRLVVQSRIICQAIRRLLLIESENNFQLTAKKLASLLSLALVTLDIPAFRPTRVERTAKIYFSPLERIAVVTYLPVSRRTLLYVQLSLGYILTQLSIVCLRSSTN